jgi:hypothetical protein
LIISPTSSPVIPAPSSKNTIIKVRSSNPKPLPEKINSDNPKGKWTKIPKEKIDSSNISTTTPKTSVPTTSNNDVKIKRKRNEVQQTADPSFVYTVESSVNTSSVHNSDDDKLDYDLASESDSHNDAELNNLQSTTSDPGAFESDAILPAQNNN